MTGRWALLGALVALGAAWGATQPMMKIAVSDGYRHFGLIFWQFVIGALFLGIINLIRRRPLPLGRPHCGFTMVIALIGTVLPNTASYTRPRASPARRASCRSSCPRCRCWRFRSRS